MDLEPAPSRARDRAIVLAGPSPGLGARVENAFFTNSKSFLYKTCHGAGHAAFLLAATRTLGWPKYNPEMWLPPRPILLIDPDVFHRFVLATCARAPTASHADACASGAYHSYFSWSAPRFGGVIPWYTPCADAPFGFANVCFVMLRLVSDNLRNVPATEDARRCDHGEDQATQLACVYGLAHRPTRNASELCDLSRLSGDRLLSCVNGSVDATFGSMFPLNTREAFCEPLGQLKDVCVRRSLVYCNSFGACRA